MLLDPAVERIADVIGDSLFNLPGPICATDVERNTVTLSFPNGEEFLITVTRIQALSRQTYSLPE